jgi:ribosome-binding ATPase YchF (GTP1/OBG family)
MMDAEFVLNDLIMVERKLVKSREEYGKFGGKEKERLAHELSLFERLHQALSEEIPLRTLEFTEEERKSISSFGFLSLKPMLKIYNLGEGQPPPNIPLSTRKLQQRWHCKAALEMEIVLNCPLKMPKCLCRCMA